MTQPRRLPSGGRIDRNKPLRFTFRGRSFLGFKGDTLASALLANKQHLVNRSFKYGRPRGIVAAGADEPNAIMQLGATEATQVPNVRATQQELYEGLVAVPVAGWPNIDFDLKSLLGRLCSRMMPVGFYYKTFMWPKKFWMTYEKFIRKAAGLGWSPVKKDPDLYDKINQYCDLLVIGGGPAGLQSTLTAARAGRRVILCDEQCEFGGNLLGTKATLNEAPAIDWVASVVKELATMTCVTMLSRATASGYHDHNFVTIHERRTEHIADRSPDGQVRSRIHRVRADQIILATGAHERPLVFGNNDIPGCMVASAVSIYINRYAVRPGQILSLCTANDAGYEAAFDWVNSGGSVAVVCDTRLVVSGYVIEKAHELGILVKLGHGIINVRGESKVNSVEIAPLNATGSAVTDPVHSYRCDTVASSGGFSPVVHLSAHLGRKPLWDETALGFIPHPDCGLLAVGSVTGTHELKEILSKASDQTAKLLGISPIVTPSTISRNQNPPMAMFLVPHLLLSSRAPKQFVDYQNDVTAADIELACREGFESIEHVKRYTALGFGTDQGKLSNVNGVALASQAQGKTIAETGTTMFRPNYTPVTFGAVAGRDVGSLFDVKRYTPMQSWHVANGAEFEDVGQWQRPWYFPRVGETMQEAVNREAKAVRNSVGILDASSLGKIDIQGPDAREFLGRIYTNAWAKLNVGRCRYGLMCGEDGMLLDDGVTACLGENHFLMTTTTGGAARVYEWLEFWHQTEWPYLEVFFTTVTDHWATCTISGPNSRAVLQKVTDLDLSNNQFQFMDWREATVAGVSGRIFRISFTGESSFEINVPAHYGLHVWEALIKAGQEFCVTPYGTETMHVLRAEKGFIIVGQDSDGSVTPADLGMSWAVSKTKSFSFVGERGMRREDCLRPDRKQLVGLKTKDPSIVLEEGAQAVFDQQALKPMPMVGHVTSSYWSPNCEHSIALGLIKGGHDRMGESVYFPLVDGHIVEAEICSPVFFDHDGVRQNG